MGFAILWIMIYHSGAGFSFLPLAGRLLNTLQFHAVGFGGMDIFLFLSGFGLYRTLSKKPGLWTFYRRSLVQVLPAYLPVLAVWLALKLPAVPPASWPRIILGNLTGSAFWLPSGPAFNWCMLALFSFYLAAPLFFKAVEQPRGTGWLIAATLVLDACFYGRGTMIAVTRFTVFAMGMALGRRAGQEGRSGQLRPGFEAACYALGLCAYSLLLIFCKSFSANTLWNGGYYWYPFIFITPALVLLLCRFFSWAEARVPLVLRGFEFAGAYSLEIYLIHIVAFEYLHISSPWAWPFIFAAMVLCGYIYHTAAVKVLALRPRAASPARVQSPLDESADGRRTYIEFLRIIACFLVIVNHTNSRIFLARSPSATWFCSLTYFFICKIAVPLFLLIMGALLLGKEDPPGKSVRRLVRVAAVFFIGSACYYVYFARQSGAAVSLQEFLLNLPKVQATNAFWYLYLYLALLCMLPILQKLAGALSKRQLEYTLFLSLGVLGTAPLLSVFFPGFSLSPYFTAGLIGPYLGQVLLGYYIERHVPMKQSVFWTSLCAFVLLTAFQVSGAYSLYLQNPENYRYALDNIQLITITASAACFYICAKYVFTKHPPRPALGKAIRGLGALTFGIYLLGDMVLSQSLSLFAALYSRMHPLAAVVLWELFIFAACALAAALLRLVPPLRKWL